MAESYYSRNSYVSMILAKSPSNEGYNAWTDVSYKQARIIFEEEEPIPTA